MTHSDKFIVREGSDLYYLIREGLGGFLSPPGHAEHSYSIIVKRGGHQMAGYSLTSILENKRIPREVRHAARYILHHQKGEITEAWIESVYKYFHNCYSLEGINRNVSDCVIPGQNCEGPCPPVEYHLAVMFIRKFDPTHQPRIDLIEEEQ